MNIEEWRDIEGYEGLYQVSNLGNVKSLDRYIPYSNGKLVFYKGKILKPILDKYGYNTVNLHKFINREQKKVHRLVAEAFISNPDNLPLINHKDENKENNCVDNLEWCDTNYNNNYGSRNEKISVSNTNHHLRSKQVAQYTLDGELVKIWPSTNECGRNGFCQNVVSVCCRGERKTYKGYIWKYLNN